MSDSNSRIDSTLDGRYHIERQLGEGGMGVVYRARDTKLDRTVALKFLASHLTLDEEAKERFIQEAKAASALDHTNICAIYDISETPEGDLYLVMAHYEGETLGHRHREEPLSADRCLSIGIQLSRALEAAHEAGIIHRDLKPANVLLTDRDEVKLLDFGLAKLASSGGDLTKTGSTLGTAGYMSPEQIDGGDVDARADLFSFGALLYELLAGQKAFEGDSPIAAAVAVLQTEPKPLAEVRPDVPANVASIVEACLRKDRDQRPGSASEVLAGLAGPSAQIAVPPLAPDEPANRPFGLRWMIPVAVGAIALWFVFVGPGLPIPLSSGSGSPTGALEGNLVAVLPFQVAGSADLDYLGKGVVDLISAKLNGAGSIRTVSPRLVIATVKEEGDALDDPALGQRIAGALGAGRYVSGELLEVGGQVTISAYLHETGGSADAPEQVSASGPTGDLFTLLDELVASLVAGSFPDEVDRLQMLATLTTPSLDAAKEYLQGEQLLREGLYREAAAAYDRSVAIDSTFALAYYRKSIAADWTDAYDVRSSADRAYALSEVLSPRDQAMIEALQLRRNGKVEEAEQAFRELVHNYPNDVEGWVQLGEAIFHDTSRRGGSTLDAIEPFSRAAELEPNNLIAQLHVARLYALFDSVEALERTTNHFKQIAPDSERTLEVESILAYLAGDSAQQADVKERLRGKPWFYQFYSAHGVSRFARDAHGAADILAMHPAEDPYVMALVPGIAAVRGKYGDAYAYLAELRGLGNPTWDVLEAFLLSSGALPMNAERAASVAARIASAEPLDIYNTSFVPPYEDFTVEFTGFHRDYFLALLWIQLGRVEEARALMNEMKARPDFAGLGSLKVDAELSIEAELLFKAGDADGALRVLRSMEYGVPHAATVWPLADLGRSRFLRAELEREIGDIEVAKRFYVGLDEPWSPWDSYWRPLLYDRLGSMAEAEGNEAEAIQYYSRIVELWRDADPEVAPLRDVILERLDRLVGDERTSR